MASAANRILNKIDAVLPERMRPELNSQTLVVPEMASYQSEQTTVQLGAVRDAINDRRRLFMNYNDARGDATERIMWPLTLVYWGFSWTLGAWCELRQRFRSFRIDRIEEAKTLGTRFPDESDKWLADYFIQFESE